MQRRMARELTLEALYRFDLTGENPSLLIEDILARKKYPAEVKEFARKLIEEVYRHIDEIDDTLKKKLEHWELHRLASIDRTILRIGCGELAYFDDVPFKVSINESIELAKKYGDHDSGKFVNGILDAVARKRSNRP